MNIRTMSNGLFWSLWGLGAVGLLAAILAVSPHVTGWGRLALAIGMTAGTFVLAVLASIRGARHRKGGMTPSGRRYILRFMPAMFAYVVILFFSTWAFKALEPKGVLAFAIAAAPALPIIAALWAVGRFLVEIEDEFERMLAIQAQMWGLGGALAICTLVGFLDTFGVAPHVPLWAAFPLHAVCSGLAQVYVKAKYR